MAAANAFPLQWPAGWKRTALAARRHSKYKQTPSSAYQSMKDELSRIGARSVVVSSNLGLGRRGEPLLDQKRPEDPGVAVYWVDREGQERSVACDKWFNPHENMRAIALSISALRSLERHGATQIMERAFQAFGALPAASAVPERRPWWEVFGLPEAFVPSLSRPMVDAKFRELSATLHPDKIGTGSKEAFDELSQAYEEAKVHYASG